MDYSAGENKGISVRRGELRKKRRLLLYEVIGVWLVC